MIRTKIQWQLHEMCTNRVRDLRTSKVRGSFCRYYRSELYNMRICTLHRISMYVNIFICDNNRFLYQIWKSIDPFSCLPRIRIAITIFSSLSVIGWTLRLFEFTSELCFSMRRLVKLIRSFIRFKNPIHLSYYRI